MYKMPQELSFIYERVYLELVTQHSKVTLFTLATWLISCSELSSNKPFTFTGAKSRRVIQGILNHYPFFHSSQKTA